MNRKYYIISKFFWSAFFYQTRSSLINKTKHDQVGNILSKLNVFYFIRIYIALKIFQIVSQSRITYCLNYDMVRKLDTTKRG